MKELTDFKGIPSYINVY